MSKRQLMHLEKYYNAALLVIALIPFIYLLSLNRIAKVPIDFYGRVLVEHFLAGFFLPIGTLFFILGFLSLFKRFRVPILEKELSNKLILLITIVFFITEFFFQFILKYNNHSISQIIISTLGMISVNIYWRYGFSSKIK